MPALSAVMAVHVKLLPHQLDEIFQKARQNFCVLLWTYSTVECTSDCDNNDSSCASPACSVYSQIAAIHMKNRRVPGLGSGKRLRPRPRLPEHDTVNPESAKPLPSRVSSRRCSSAKLLGRRTSFARSGNEQIVHRILRDLRQLHAISDKHTTTTSTLHTAFASFLRYSRLLRTSLTQYT